MTVPDFPDEKAPDAHAVAISLTGAPPLVFKNILDLLLSQNLPAGGTITRPASGLFTLNQPAYEVLIGVNTAGTPAPIVSVELQWVESFTGLVLDSEIYYFYSGDVNGHQIHGRGPTKADRVKVIFTNYSGTVACSVTYVLLQTSRTFTREFWKTITKGAVAPVIPGFTLATQNIAANVLATQLSSVTASGITNLLMPLYTGTVRLFGVTTDTVVGNSLWQVVDSADRVINGQVTFESSNGQTGFAPRGASTLYIAELALPRSQCTLQLINNSTATQQLISTVVAQEDRA